MTTPIIPPIADDEEWRDVPGYEGLCQVSNYGRVLNLHFRNSKEARLRKVHASGRGYLRINMQKNGMKKTLAVHRMVAEAFISNPDNKPFIHHKDGNKTNNHINNLEWVTHDENMAYAAKAGLMHIGENNGMSKLTRDDVIAIRKSTLSHVELSKTYGVTQGNIFQIRNYFTWRHVQQEEY